MGQIKQRQSILRFCLLIFFIKIIWQTPNSPPEVNMFNLGAWMAIHSIVEMMHPQLPMNEDVLAAIHSDGRILKKDKK